MTTRNAHAHSPDAPPLTLFTLIFAPLFVRKADCLRPSLSLSFAFALPSPCSLQIFSPRPRENTAKAVFFVLSGVRTRTKSVLFCKTNARRISAGAVISVCVTAHRSSSMALDFAYAVDFASKKSVLMRFALEYWLTHAIDAGSVS